jgi:uncharacterized protein (DUF2141 family)
MMLMSATFAWAATLTVHLPNVANDAGSVRCALYDAPEAFPGRPDLAFRFQEHPARPGSMICTFDGLPPGTYAVAVAHDANRSGGLDRSAVGRPTEGWGTSNNVTHLFSGPTFQESTIRVDGATTIDVVLHYP